MSTTNKSTSWLWTMSFWISWMAVVFECHGGTHWSYQECRSLCGVCRFDDKWWLCDDTTVKGMSPPPSPRKATFLLYKRKRTDLLVPYMS